MDSPRQVTTIQQVVQQKLKSLARDAPLAQPVLSLKVVKANPLELSDGNGLLMKTGNEYQSKFKVLQVGDDIMIQNYDVQVKIQKFQVQSVKIHLKEILYGTSHTKKVQGLDITFNIQNLQNRLVNDESRSYINRQRKHETADKFSHINTLALIPEEQLKTKLTQRKNVLAEDGQKDGLDSHTTKTLKKIRKTIRKTQLFNLMARKGVTGADSKRNIRQMLFSDSGSKELKTPFCSLKKGYGKKTVKELSDKYKN